MRVFFFLHFWVPSLSVGKDPVFHLQRQNFVYIISIHILTHEKKISQLSHSEQLQFKCKVRSFIRFWQFLSGVRDTTFCSHNILNLINTPMVMGSILSKCKKLKKLYGPSLGVLATWRLLLWPMGVN